VSSGGSRLATVVKRLSLLSSPRTCSLYMIQACEMQRFQRNRKLQWKREALGPQAVCSLGQSREDMMVYLPIDASKCTTDS